MLTVVQKDMHYCGGTDKGCQYLEQAPWIPYSLGSIAPKPGKTIPIIFDVQMNDNFDVCSEYSGSHSMKTSEQPPQMNFRVHVEKLFNHLYGMIFSILLHRVLLQHSALCTRSQVALSTSLMGIPPYKGHQSHSWIMYFLQILYPCSRQSHT